MSGAEIARPKFERSDARGALRISVVIPHLNQPEALVRCLDSLARGSSAPEEIIVVDNGSDNSPEVICSTHPATMLLHETGRGPGPARNRGVAAASGDVFAFIDSDCIADAGWISAIRTAFLDPSAEILGGDVRIAMENPDQPTLLEAYESVYAYRMDRYIAEQGFTGTGNLAVRKSVFEAVGPFRGLEVAEDREWGQRATRSGYNLCFLPEMRVYHPARVSFAELASKWDRHTAHDYITFRGRRWGRLRWGLRMLAVALSPPAEIGRIAISERISGTRARALAWMGVARIRLYRARIMAQLLLGASPEALAEKWNRN